MDNTKKENKLSISTANSNLLSFWCNNKYDGTYKKTALMLAQIPLLHEDLLPKRIAWPDNKQLNSPKASSQGTLAKKMFAADSKLSAKGDTSKKYVLIKSSSSSTSIVNEACSNKNCLNSVFTSTLESSTLNNMLNKGRSRSVPINKIKLKRVFKNKINTSACEPSNNNTNSNNSSSQIKPNTLIRCACCKTITSQVNCSQIKLLRENTKANNNQSNSSNNNKNNREQLPTSLQFSWKAKQKKLK